MFSRRAIFGLKFEKELVQSTSKPQNRVTDSFLSLLFRVCSAEHVNFLVLQLTSDNSNPRKLERKSISPGFSSCIYCNFTLGNSNPR